MNLLSSLVMLFLVLLYLGASIITGQFRPNRVRLSQNVSHQIMKTKPGQTFFKCSESGKQQFTCNSGQCLNISRLCNGIKDCADGSDETVQACKNIVCRRNTFKCRYGACIKAEKKCDGRRDCVDHSDEKNCRYRAQKRCEENQWQCKISGKCIPKTVKCNGKKDCDDGSDETKQECPASEPTEIPSSPQEKQNTTLDVYAAGGGCSMPDGSDTTITFIGNTNRTSTKAPEFSMIEVFCKNGQKIQRAVCSKNGEWSPPLQSCQNQCPTLRPVHMDLSCFRGDHVSIDCDADLPHGTRVKPRCKPFHTTKTTVNYTELRCQANGEWDNELFECSPDDYCGIPSEEPSEPPSTLHWTPVNTSAYPWHVAIYNTARNNSLLCGGTLISPNLVVTAAVCFYTFQGNERRDGLFDDDDIKGFFHRNNDSITDYKLVVSKYTVDYETMDNVSPKKYEIQQVIFPDDMGLRVPYLTFFNSNIAVLVLKKMIEETKLTRPACIDWGAAVRGLRQSGEGTSATLAGWMSVLNVTNITTLSLHHARFSLTSAEQCSGTLIRISNIFCAGYDSGVRVPRESYTRGGGLVFDDANAGRYTLRGIVLESQRAAGGHNITVFADVSKHIVWLKKVRDKFSDRPLTISNLQLEDFQSITSKTTDATLSNSESPTLENTHNVAATSRNNATNISASSNGVCDVPDGADVTVVLTDDNDAWLNISQTGSSAPKYSKIEVFCNTKYALPGGEKVQRSVCLPKKSWNPPLKSCLKTCPSLYPENLYLSCYRENLEVDCADEMVSGTRVRPRCKPLYHSEKEVYRELNCQENGEWDGELVGCVPDCGVTNSTVILKETELLIYNGVPANVSDTPWHVAIYRFSASSEVLICGGTLISPNMVVSAAHCFFDQGRGLLLNSTREYEIVVSKYTRNYATVDNGYQKNYKIREIIFTPLGYNPTLHGQHSNDIAVLVLQGSVEMNAFVLPACVDWTADDTNGFHPPENTTGKLVGWGVDKIEGMGSSILLYAELPYISLPKCAGKLKEIDPDKFCAGSSKGPGAQKGDSGGGLMFRNAIDGRYFLRGIVSTKDKESRNSIAAFTDVSKYMDWLEKIRARVTTKTSLTTGVCDITHSPDKKFDVFDENDNWLNIAPGSKAPKWSTIKVTCNPGYTTANGGSLQRSTCFEEENWNPSLRPCLKICPPLRALNMVITCYREDSEIDCEKDLISGDRVQPRCKPLYRRGTEANYMELRCRENGEWDKELFECVAECGIINTEAVQPTTHWTPANSSAYPWHVAVYKPSWNNALIWGGTLISPYMVITARRYYLPYSQGEGYALDMLDTDFVVVVGKQTSNYTIRDSPYQKTYEVRYRLTPIEKGSTALIAANDIQILVLKKPVEMSKFVLPACVHWSPSTSSSFQAEEGIVGKLATWTLNETTDLRSPSLQQAVFPFVSLPECQPRLPLTFVFPNTFCTEGTFTVSLFTMGMNGEGLVVRDPMNGRYFLRGLAFTIFTSVSKLNLTNGITRFLDPLKHTVWLRSVRDRVQAEVTPAREDSVRVCTVPYGSENRIVLTDTNDNRLNITTRLKAPKFAKVKITCNPKYLLSNGDRIQRSICVEKEHWNPPLRPCLRICPVLSSDENGELLCYRDDFRVDCDGDLLQDTIIRPHCKPFYKHERKEAYSEFRCLENGKWNNTLSNCVPADCGIPNTKPVQPPSPNQWTPINPSDVPWNVAIYTYNTVKNNFLLCGGTLISPYMIITLAICFYRVPDSKVTLWYTYFDRLKDVETPTNYKIVVSKYKLNYYSEDNDYQKKYSVREIIFPENVSPSAEAILIGSNNIAVLVPETPVEIGKFVLPVCFDWTVNMVNPDLAWNASNELQLVSWGYVNSTYRLYKTLQYSQITVSPCQGDFALIQNIFCTPLLQDKESRSPGNGFTSYDSTTGRHILRGISFFGEKFADPPREMHVDVSKFSEWLTKVRDKVSTISAE